MEERLLVLNCIKNSGYICFLDKILIVLLEFCYKRVWIVVIKGKVFGRNYM